MQKKTINAKSKKLRDLRLFYGLSQRELGQKLGLSREAIASYEYSNNPIPAGTILKITQLMGIGSEYFETDMSLEEAIKKYAITPANMLVGNFDDIGFYMYDNIKNYINNEPIEQKIKFKFQILNLLLDLSKRADYHFIKIHNSSYEPFAKKGDIIVVLKEKATNGDFILACFQQSYMIFQYLVAGIDEALLKSSNNIEIRLKGDEREQLEVLGVIKQKISLSL